MKHFKRALVLLVLILPALAAGTGMAAASDTFAREIHTAFMNLTPYPLPSLQIGDLSPDQAYEIQEEVVSLARKNGETVMGYKAGLTSEPAQKRFGVSEAARGTLYKSMLRWPGILHQKNFKKPFIETEIGFRFSRDITQAVSDPADLKKSVAIVFPAVELPDLFYADMKQLKGTDIIASNVAARKVLIGQAKPVAAQDLNAVSVTLFSDGKEIGKGKGRNAMGDQWQALQWTVNQVIKTGGSIQQGQIIITGSLTPLVPMKPGTYLADFGAFGSLAFEYR